MSLLVTGGSGFIGSNFIRLQVRSGLMRIVNLDKLTYAANPNSLADIASDERYSFARGDIGDPDLVGRLLRDHGIEAIVHFAAESHVDRSILGPASFIETNLVGTFRLLEAVRGYWSQLPEDRRARFRFVHVSTDEVYGSLAPDAPAFAETNQYQPNSPYSASKAGSDHLVRAYHHTYGLPVVTTNCSNNYGPYQFPEKMIPLCIHNALSGKPLPIYGDGMQVRDWLYVEDHCRAIVRVLQAGKCGEVYNIGGRNEMPNLSIVHLLCEELDRAQPQGNGRSYKEQITFVADRPGHDRRYAIDARKIEHELGWRPAETFETGLRKTVRWYLEHGDWVRQVTSGEYRTWIDRQYSARGAGG